MAWEAVSGLLLRQVQPASNMKPQAEGGTLTRQKSNSPAESTDTPLPSRLSVALPGNRAKSLRGSKLTREIREGCRCASRSADMAHSAVPGRGSGQRPERQSQAMASGCVQHAGLPAAALA